MHAPKLSLAARSGQYRGHKKSLGPLKISHEMDHKVICPQKNNIPHFQNQRYINSYLVWVNKIANEKQFLFDYVSVEEQVYFVYKTV